MSHLINTYLSHDHISDTGSSCIQLMALLPVPYQLVS